MDRATPLSDIPMPIILQQLVHPGCRAMLGQCFCIAHLKSERGQPLNGKICVVRDFDKTTIDARLHCKIEDEQEIKMIKLKAKNLVPVEAKVLENFMLHSSPISDTKLAACLERTLEEHSGPIDRADFQYRLGLYAGLLEKLQNTTSLSSPPLTDADYCFPCGAGSDLLGDGEDNPFAVVMHSAKPACVDNEILDVRHMDLGLKGDGHTNCSICSEVILDTSHESHSDVDDLKKQEDSIVLVTLPCFHVFHEQCLLKWLESNLGQRNWNCPTCRASVPDEMSTYCVKYDEQLQRRFDEYPLSGFCTKCMMWNMERNRNQILGYGDGAGGIVAGL